VEHTEWRVGWNIFVVVVGGLLVSRLLVPRLMVPCLLVPFPGAAFAMATVELGQTDWEKNLLLLLLLLKLVLSSRYSTYIGLSQIRLACRCE
jgi:hypothetical protein